MFIAELEHPRFGDFDLLSLRTGIMAGSPCPVEVMKKVQADMHMDEVTICYGMTETSPVSFQTGTDDPVDKRVATVGRIHPHVEVKVVDPDNGRVVPRGTTGELCTRGYVVMLGYWENPEATGRRSTRPGWMHTGDLATLDADGYANIVGRIKDMVIRAARTSIPRGRGVPLPAPGRRRRAGGGRARRPLRRGAVRLGAAARGPGGHGDELRRVVPGPDRPSRSPATGGSSDEFPMTVTGKVQKFKMRETSVAELGLEAPGGSRPPESRTSCAPPDPEGPMPPTRSTTGRPAGDPERPPPLVRGDWMKAR
jgi:fatty-acyl-CoA synthase